MSVNEYDKLNKKYNELVAMLRESLELGLCEYKEKSKRNRFFLDYKKRVYEEIHKLKHQMQVEKELLDKYKDEIFALKKENFILKSKFKHLSEIFKTNKEQDLLNKYFPDRLELESTLSKLIKKVLQEKFNPSEVNVIYFRKYFDKIFTQYLIKYVKSVVDSEKLAILISQIIKQEAKNFINQITAKNLMDRINLKKEYEEFLEILLKQDIVEKDKIYKHLELNYSIDNIKRIVHNYQSIKKDENIENLSFSIEMKEIQEEKEKLNNNKKDLNQALYDLQKEEDDILAKIVLDEDSKEEYKERIDEIDIEKRNLKEKLQEIDQEIKKLENRELFIKPLLDLEDKKHVNESDKKYIDEYNELINKFSSLLKELT